MKAKKMTLMVVVVLSIMVLLATNAISATFNFYSCEVISVGPAGSTYYIKITDTAATPAFTNHWYVIPDAFKKEYLAIALTAMAGNMVVRIKVNPQAQYTDVAAIYLRHQ